MAGGITKADPLHPTRKVNLASFHKFPVVHRHASPPSPNNISYPCLICVSSVAISPLCVSLGMRFLLTACVVSVLFAHAQRSSGNCCFRGSGDWPFSVSGRSCHLRAERALSRQSRLNRESWCCATRRSAHRPRIAGRRRLEIIVPEGEFGCGRAKSIAAATASNGPINGCTRPWRRTASTTICGWRGMVRPAGVGIERAPNRSPNHRRSTPTTRWSMCFAARLELAKKQPEQGKPPAKSDATPVARAKNWIERLAVCRRRRLRFLCSGFNRFWSTVARPAAATSTSGEATSVCACAGRAGAVRHITRVIWSRPCNG